MIQGTMAGRDVLLRCVVAFGLLIPLNAVAAPITFNTALPVASREGILRGQYVLVRATGDPASLGRRITVQAVPATLAYGVTPRLALFGILPYFDKSLELDAPGGRIERGASGFGDLHYPTGVTVSPDDGLLVADAYNHQLQWFDPGGIPIRRVGYRLFLFWPRSASSRRGFNVPTGVAAGPDGLVHVADSGNHRIVMLTAEGNYVTDWLLPDANPDVFSPEQIAVSADGGTLYATDLASNRIVVLRVDR